jgi:hypothetical protein
MTVNHNPYDIANVLSLESIKGKHRVTYDSWDRDGVFKVHTKEGVVGWNSSRVRKGFIHYHNTSEGMVQAWVGQKLFNCFILRVFTPGCGKNS